MGTGSDFTAQQARLNPVVSIDVVHSLRQPRDYSHLLSLSLAIWTPPRASHMFPPLCSQRPSDELPELVLLVDTIFDSSFRPCLRMLGSRPIEVGGNCCHAHILG